VRRRQTNRIQRADHRGSATSTAPGTTHASGIDAGNGSPVGLRERLSFAQRVKHASNDSPGRFV
jgi:hypothetical protein